MAEGERPGGGSFVSGGAGVPRFFLPKSPGSRRRAEPGARGTGAVPVVSGLEAVRGIGEGVEARVEALGFEVVEVEWGGTARRPVLRVRVDRPDSVPGRGVTVDDCVRLSRALEAWLDEEPTLSARYVLEVSSPGVERPLSRRRDFVRFSGRDVVLRGAPGAAAAAFSGRLSGVLEGIEEDGDGYRVVIRTADASRVTVPRAEIARANLVFDWNQGG